MLLFVQVCASVCGQTEKIEVYRSSFDGYCSTVQGLLDWFEVDLGFTKVYRSSLSLPEPLSVFVCVCGYRVDTDGDSLGCPT